MDKKSRPWYYALDWKHYAAAGVVVAILLSLLLLRAVNQEEATIDEPSPDNVDVPSAPTAEPSSPGIGDPIGGFLSRLSLGSSWTWMIILMIPILIFMMMGHRNIGMVIAFIIPLVIIIPMFYSVSSTIVDASNSSGVPISGTASALLSFTPYMLVLGVIVTVVAVSTGLFGRD